MRGGPASPYSDLGWFFQGTYRHRQHLTSDPMKSPTLLAVACYLAGAGMCLGQFHTNVITTPNDMWAYRVDGGTNDNPTIMLEAGVTNILDIQAYPDHPVIILTDVFEIYN